MTENNNRTLYAEAKRNIFAVGTAPDGYFGKRANVGFVLLGKQVYIVADCGYYNAGLGDCITEREALWQLINHPAAKNYTITKSASL